MSEYRRPGVYLEERLGFAPTEGAATNTVAVFVGVTSKGPINEPVRIDSWSDFTQTFGGFGLVPFGGQALEPVTVGVKVKASDITQRPAGTPKDVTLAFTKAAYGTPIGVPEITFAAFEDAATDVLSPLHVANMSANEPPEGWFDIGDYVRIAAEPAGGDDEPAAHAWWNPNTALWVKVAVGGSPQGAPPAQVRFGFEVGVVSIPLTEIDGTVDNTVDTYVDGVLRPGTGNMFVSDDSTLWQPVRVGSDYVFPLSEKIWVKADADATLPAMVERVARSKPGTTRSYLPYNVYAFYQNGGRAAFVVRVAPSDANRRGVVAKVPVAGLNEVGAAEECLMFEAIGAGAWGNSLKVVLDTVMSGLGGRVVYNVTVISNNSPVEAFTNLSMGGVDGTRQLVATINDAVSGSRYVKAVLVNDLVDPAQGTYALDGGENMYLPDASELTSGLVTEAVKQVEGPTLVTFSPFMRDGQVIMPIAASLASALSDKDDTMVIWDSDPLALVSTTAFDQIKAKAASVGAGDSLAAFYGPWILVPDAARPGGTISIPPSGAIIGMMARIENTIGVWRSPAGIPAVLATAVAVESKFTDAQQGELNTQNINLIRPVPGVGICAMGARTRKMWGPDRYISNRRTITYLKERLRAATQYAVFENNDQRLWSSLRNVATRVVDPLWEQGGLKGTTASDAYYVRCDETLNTPQVIQSGEVRMEVGIALQHPAEFVIIRLSQFDSGTSLVSESV